MPGNLAGLQAFWYGLSAGQVRALAVLIGLGVFLEVVFIGYLLLFELRSPGKMIVITGLLSGVVSAVLAWSVMTRARERRLDLVERLRVIREMNHHTRNALEQINYSAYSTGDRELIVRIRAAAARIEWALREVLTQHNAVAAQGGGSGSHSGSDLRPPGDTATLG